MRLPISRLFHGELEGRVTALVKSTAAIKQANANIVYHSSNVQSIPENHALQNNIQTYSAHHFS